VGKYGKAAQLAVDLMSSGKSLQPRDAWERAVSRVFPDSPSSRAKGCPRDSFLALCELGAVKNVSSGKYTRSIMNKGYVTRALAALRTNPTLARDEKALWRIATAGKNKVPNCQMEVLVALWSTGGIRK
jgi:hypothetical protein